MKKLINSQQKSSAEYICQACLKNEAVLQIQGSGWMLHIQGKFCENCAILKIKHWNPTNTPKDLHLLCSECSRYKDQQTENNHLLQSLDMEHLLNEIARRVKSND